MICRPSYVSFLHTSAVDLGEDMHGYSSSLSVRVSGLGFSSEAILPVPERLNLTLVCLDCYLSLPPRRALSLRTVAALQALPPARHRKLNTGPSGGIADVYICSSPRSVGRDGFHIQSGTRSDRRQTSPSQIRVR